MLCIVRQSVNIGSSRVAGQSLSRLQQQGWRGNVKLMVSAKNGAIAIIMTIGTLALDMTVRYFAQSVRRRNCWRPTVENDCFHIRNAYRECSSSQMVAPAKGHDAGIHLRNLTSRYEPVTAREFSRKQTVRFASQQWSETCFGCAGYPVIPVTTADAS